MPVTCFWWDIVSSVLVGASVCVLLWYKSAFLAVYFVLLAIWVQVRRLRYTR